MKTADNTPVPSRVTDPASWVDPERPRRRRRSGGYEAMAARLDDMFVAAVAVVTRDEPGPEVP